MSAQRTLMTTHKVVIDANDEQHARWLEEALTNDGYRVRREVHRLVSDGGNVTIERKAAGGETSSGEPA
jgi:hypothetical protein